MEDTLDRHFEVLLTAQEAYPALERQFLAANTEIAAGFRILDVTTKLRSPEACELGETWFDLIVETLNRGVRISIAITDFDPVVRLENHQYTWRCVRQLHAAAEASRHPELLSVSASMHPARVGLLPRLLLWPRLIKEINAELADAALENDAARDDFLKTAPRLRPMLRNTSDGLRARRFPPPALVPATHHQKLAVFDKQRLYIGGLDLNDRRYDTPAHQQSADQTWHDVQVIVDGPVAEEAASHLASFQAVTKGRKPHTTKLLLRTLSARRKLSLPFMSPKPVVGELAERHKVQIAETENLVYLETQFFRDRDLANELARRAQEKPGLTMILILPAAPEDVAFKDEPGSDAAYGEHLQRECIEIVQGAFGPRVFIGSPAQPRPTNDKGRAALFGAPLVYLHAKVSIFDDQYAMVASANLNGRSFAWDTEAGIGTQSTAEVAQLKSRCFSHWLGPDADPACFSDLTACEAWSAHAARNAQLEPTERKGFLLPYAIGSSSELARNLPGVPEEMV